MTTQVLYLLLSQLANHKQSKDVLMSVYVRERLDKSFELYTKELEQGLEFLARKHEKSLIMRMKKLDD